MEFKGTKGTWVIENLHEPEKLEGKADMINISALKVTNRINHLNIITVWRTNLFSENAKANALLISKSPVLLQAIHDSIEPLKKAGLKEMADYHEKIYFESINL